MERARLVRHSLIDFEGPASKVILPKLTFTSEIKWLSQIFLDFDIEGI